MRLSARHSHKIEVHFPYNPTYVNLIREVDNARFQGKDKGGPYWKIPQSLTACREMRTLFGDKLDVHPNLAEWARDEVRRRKELGALAHSGDATLSNLPGLLPPLAETLHDYQRVAAAFGSRIPGTLIADQPGLGKTLETIAAIYEGNSHIGDHLIIAPKTSLYTVWVREINKWGTGDVFLYAGSKKQKNEALAAFKKSANPTRWLVTNPEAIRFKTITDESQLDPRTMDYKKEEVPREPFIHENEWQNIVIDECHKGAIRNPDTVTARSLYALPLAPDGKKFALSGTPMKNKPEDLWGVLHWLYPEQYTSKWEWARTYCVLESNGFGTNIGAIRKDREEELQETLSTLMMRRTKAEVYKELPPKQYVDVWCDMVPSQANQYKMMERDAMVRIADHDLPATNVLVELLRLKQFAVAKHEVPSIIRDGGEVTIEPTAKSGKLESLTELLNEREIFSPTPDGEQAVVFSQFSTVVDVFAEALAREGAAVSIITGKRSGYLRRGKRKSDPVQFTPATREEVMDDFQSDGGSNLCFMTTQAGGVAITLDRADSVFFVDEMWSPADMEQAEDRVHRVSRMHNVTVYVLRSRGTIDEHIMNILAGKEKSAKAVLDEWRNGAFSLA